MERKHEGRSLRMTRRHGRLLVFFLAAICLTLLLRAPTVIIFPILRSSADPPKLISKIAKATVATNTLNGSLIDRALQTHQVQNEIHGYIHHVTGYELVSDFSEYDSKDRPRGAWSKPAYLLALIALELAKPEAERLEWIFWFDADTLVLNPHTPLEIFLPPSLVPELENIHLLMAKNMDGLNSGAFALRVHPWSVSILSTILAYPIYEAARYNTDQFRDQSAFQWLLAPNANSPLFKDPMKGRENWAEVPMRWFNSLPFNNAFAKNWDWVFNHNLTGELFDNGTTEVYKDGHKGGVKPWKVMQGDMVVHFAGASPVRDSWMGGWLERAEAYLPEWSNATKRVDLKTEASIFWDAVASKINRDRITLQDAANAPVVEVIEITSKTATQTEDKSERPLTVTSFGNVPVHATTSSYSADI